MIDHASKHLDPALTPQLLLKAANQIKGIVWVSSFERLSRIISVVITLTSCSSVKTDRERYTPDKIGL